MRHGWLIICMGLFAGCQSGGFRQPKQFTAANLDSLNNSRIGPLLMNLESRKAGAILDSLQPHLEEGDAQVQHKWYILKAQQQLIEKRFDSARYFINSAISIAANNQRERDLMVAKARLAEVDVFQKRWKKALGPALDAYFLSRKYDTMLPFLNYRLYEIYDAIGDKQNARKYLFEGFDYARHHPHLKIFFSQGIAEYYDNIGQTDSAIYFFKTLEKDTSFYSKEFLVVRDANLGVLLTRRNKAREGLNYLLKAMPVQKQLGIFKPLSMYNIGNAYYQLDSFAMASRYLDTALLYAKRSNDLRMIRQVLHLKGQVYATRKDYQNAFTALSSAYEAFPKEMDSSLTAKARELEAQYALKEKEDRIAALAYANKIESKIADQQKIIIFTLALMILLSFVTGFQLWRRRRLQMQITESNLRFQLLRAQMEPHFLFNLLGDLQSFIRQGLIDKSLSYLTKTARFFRWILEYGRHDFIRLKDEITTLENYLGLQVQFFEGRFAYDIQIDKELEQDNIFIPPMLLQPFIENAVLHGFVEINYKGHISIHLTKGEKVLVCLIEDNGTGFSTDVLQQNKRSSSQITRERLTLLSRQTGTKSFLSITDKSQINDGSGVRVKLIVPYLTREAANILSNGRIKDQLEGLR